MKSRETQEMFNFISRNPEESLVALAARLVEAGYRKFEIVDEPSAPADGGAAFGELTQIGDRAIKQGGLTVRDYFAAKALQGIMANEAAVQRYATQSQAEGFEPIALMTTMAYYSADMMLVERAK